MVYLDQIWAGSVVMHLVILWMTARLAGLPVKKWRLGISAALGGFYSLVLFVPAVGFLTHPGYKFLLSLAMVALAYAPVAPKKLILLLTYFYLVTFALGGTVLGIINYVQQTWPGQLMMPMGQVVQKYFGMGILLALAIAVLGGLVVPLLMQQKIKWQQWQSQVDVYLQGRHTSVAAYLDTGNNLTDPATGYPVLVLEYCIAEKILPPYVCEAIGRHGLENSTAVLETVGDQVLQCHLRLIPCHTLGARSGWLLGFRPDQVVIKQNNQLWQTGAVVVAISPCKIHLHPQCQAILPPQLLKTG